MKLKDEKSPTEDLRHKQFKAINIEAHIAG